MSPIEITLLLLVLAVVLFSTEKFPVDVIGLMLVSALVLSGILSVNEALAGFGNDIIITIGGLFILVGGIIKTGLVDVIGRRLHRIAGDSEFVLVTLIMATAAFASSFINNTTTAAMLLPVVIGLATRTKIPPSKLLMPLAFGSILGGSCTLIGTSTNLAVSGALERYGYEPISMFELTPIGVIMVAIGIFYMVTIGRKLLPSAGGGESLTEEYNIREYISELVVLPDSRLVGKTLGESNISTELELTVIGIIRGDERLISPSSRERIQRRDVLIVEGKMTDILRVKEEVGLEIRPDFKLNDDVLESGEIQLYEVLITSGSMFAGQTLKSLRFRQRFNLTVLAINRHRKTIIEKLSNVTLTFGDVLLIQGSRREIDTLTADGEIILLEDVSEASTRIDRRKWAIAGFLLFLTLSVSRSTIGFDVPLALCVLAGVFVMLLTNTVRYSEMYSLIDFRLLVLIACMMSFGVAMENTGTDKYLADLIEVYFGQYGSIAILAGFFLLTVMLTQPMSNQAAALVVLPIAIKTAVAMGLNPRTFAIVVTLAASFSFITPLEPACVLVYTPGRYRFFDFVKVGTILTIIVFAVTLLLVPTIWPL